MINAAMKIEFWEDRTQSKDGGNYKHVYNIRRFTLNRLEYDDEAT